MYYIIPSYHGIACYHTPAMMRAAVAGPEAGHPSPVDKHQTVVRLDCDVDDDDGTDIRLLLDVMTEHNR